MKKCPTCQKTFDDSMRFCQVDGTPLVDDVPEFDPYATIVASSPLPKADSAPPAPEPMPEPAAVAPEAEFEHADTDPKMGQSVSSIAIHEPEEVLEVPSTDPLKTMFVSDEEMKAALSDIAKSAEPEVMEIPPVETPSPAPPSFLSPEPPPADIESVKDEAVASDMSETVYAPSVSAADDVYSKEAAPFEEAATIMQPSYEPEPLPSYSEPEPVPAYSDPEPVAPPSPFETPSTPQFSEPDPAPAASVSPFEPTPAAPVVEWTPPPAPDANWQNQEIGSNTPFQPPPAGVAAGGQNKVLPIVSLVAGILSLCCYLSPATGLVALITGFLGMKNANNDPANFGGKGLAITGMIMGGILFLLGIVWYAIILFFGGLSAVMGR